MGVLGEVSVARFQGPPQQTGEGHESWLTRSANFVVRLTRARAGACIERVDNADEYLVLLPDAGAKLKIGGETRDVEPGSLVVVPPGPSSILVERDGVIVSIFSSQAADLMEAAENAGVYRRDVGAAPLQSWPEPIDGYRLRVYRLEDYSRDDTLMRLFRTRNLMINVFRRRVTPRDTTKLSPHAHQDFEQGSLTLAGRWIHHVRFPWTADLSTWKADEAIEVASPSLTIIPSQAIHTSRNLDEHAWLIDVFSPPRADFARRPGLVCNAREYPAPPEIAALPPLLSAD